MLKKTLVSNQRVTTLLALLLLLISIAGCVGIGNTYRVNDKVFNDSSYALAYFESEILVPQLNQVTLSNVQNEGRAVFIIPSREVVNSKGIRITGPVNGDIVLYLQDFILKSYTFTYQAVQKAKFFSNIDFHQSSSPESHYSDAYDYFIYIDLQSPESAFLKLRTKYSSEVITITSIAGKSLPDVCSSVAQALIEVKRGESQKNSVINDKAMVSSPQTEEFQEEFTFVKRSKKNIDAVAVIFGAKSYRGDIPNVDVAIRDAAAMKRYVINTLGFRPENVIYQEDPSLSDFNTVFGTDRSHKGKLYSYVRPNGSSDIFIYYSGHGAPDPETQSAFFVPVDCDPATVVMGGYSMATFYSNLSKIPSRNVTVIIDACFSGGSHNGMLLKNMSPVFINAKPLEVIGNNVSAFHSTSENQVSTWYEEKGYSLFTYYYLKGIQGEADLNSDGKITNQEIQSWLDDNVPYMARRLNNREQIPRIKGAPDNVLVEY